MPLHLPDANNRLLHRAVIARREDDPTRAPRHGLDLDLAWRLALALALDCGEPRPNQRLGPFPRRPLLEPVNRRLSHRNDTVPVDRLPFRPVALELVGVDLPVELRNGARRLVLRSRLCVVQNRPREKGLGRLGKKRVQRDGAVQRGCHGNAAEGQGR